MNDASGNGRSGGAGRGYTVGMAPAKRSRTRAVRQHVPPCIPGLALRSKRWMEVNGQFAIGEGGGELLKAIEAEGSLVGGARRVGWSYRHAWGYVRRAERVLGVPLLSTKPGKGRTRGAVLTSDARTVVASLLTMS